MEPLSDLLQHTSKSVRIDVLASCFVFPRTASLEQNNPFTSYDVEKLDLATIRGKVETDAHMVAANIRNDVLLILDAINEIKEDLLLDRMDAIVIYRGGLDVLCINVTSNKSGRSAYIEINDYKRRLMQLAMKPKESTYAQTLVVGLAGILGGLLLQYGGQLFSNYLQKK